MTVHIKLEDLSLRHLEYDDDVLRYNGYRLELWNSFIVKLTENFDIAQELFFQDEVTIDKELVKEAGFDETETVHELINLLFDNVQKAVAVQKYTLAQFQDIEEGTVLYNSPVTYTFAGTDINAYYENEAIIEAKEARTDFLLNNPLYDIVDEYVLDYLDYIDIPKLTNTLRELVSNESEIEWDMPDDDIQFITEYTKRFEDIVEQIEDNDYFDFDKLVDSEITDISEALEEIQGLIGDLVYESEIQVGKWETQTVYLFESY